MRKRLTLYKKVAVAILLVGVLVMCVESCRIFAYAIDHVDPTVLASGLVIDLLLIFIAAVAMYVGLVWIDCVDSKLRQLDKTSRSSQ